MKLPSGPDIINQYRSLVEPFATIVINVFQRFDKHVGTDTISLGQQENDKIKEALSCEQNTNSEYQMEEEVSPFPGGADIGSSQLQLSDSVIN